MIDLRTISPLDMETIVESVKKTNRAIVVQEAQRSAGVAAEVIAQINEKAILHLEARYCAVAPPDTVRIRLIEDQWVPNAARIVETLKQVWISKQGLQRPKEVVQVATFEYRFPELGEGLQRAKSSHWHIKPGDSVQEDDIIMEVQNDKAVVEVPSPVTGKVLEIKVEEGTVATVGQVVAVFDAEGEVPVQDAPAAEEPAAAPEPARRKHRQRQKHLLQHQQHRSSSGSNCGAR